jgi:RNA polymerase-binding transcription factor DksA
VTENDATALALQGNTDVDSILEREVAEAAAARVRDAIADVDAALARLDDGTYGTCEICSRPIGEERLAAIPHARTCVACPAGRPPLPGGRPPRS